eukprot:c17981_g1_i3.p1 GENE.c17981_g1_i3~~c17981_g1_i3.p1  ORF type:complete len:174 (+),score=31.85 c17981_g1_i3:1-522(+)
MGSMNKSSTTAAPRWWGGRTPLLLGLAGAAALTTVIIVLRKASKADRKRSGTNQTSSTTPDSTLEPAEKRWEWAVRLCGAHERSVMKTLFVEMRGDIQNLCVAAMVQKCDNEMSAYTRDSIDERKNKSDKFVRWAKIVVDELAALGHWGDAIDPLSGQPVTLEQACFLFFFER